jgi:hypothetical protein
MRKNVRAIFDRPESLNAEDIAKSEILKELIKKHLPLSIEDAIVDRYLRSTTLIIILKFIRSIGFKLLKPVLFGM